MTGHRVSDEQITDMVARTRAEQGLPPTVTDPVVLDRVASLLGPWLTDQPTSVPAREEPGHAA